MRVDVIEPGFPCVSLQILDEGVRGERSAWPPRTVVSGPQGTLASNHVPALAHLKIVKERSLNHGVVQFAHQVAATLDSVSHDERLTHESFPRQIPHLHVRSSQGDDLVTPASRFDIP